MGIDISGTGDSDPLKDSSEGHKSGHRSPDPLEITEGTAPKEPKVYVRGADGPTLDKTRRGDDISLDTGFLTPRVRQTNFKSRREQVIEAYEKNWRTKAYLPVEKRDIEYFAQFQKAVLEILDRSKVDDTFLDPDGRFMVDPHSEVFIEPRVVIQKKSDSDKEVIQASGILELRDVSDGKSLIWFKDHCGNRRWQRFDEGYAVIIASYLQEIESSESGHIEFALQSGREIGFSLSLSREALHESIRKLAVPKYRERLREDGVVEGAILETGLLQEHTFAQKIPASERYDLVHATIEQLPSKNTDEYLFRVQHKGSETIVLVSYRDARLEFKTLKAQ